MSDLTLADRTLRLLAMKIVVERLTDALKEERAAYFEALLSLYSVAGVKSMDSRLPDGTKVGSVTLTVPKDTTTVTDEDALLKWAETSAPWLLREEVVPAQPARPAVPEHTVTVLDPKQVTTLLSAVRPVSGTTVVLDPDTGEIVEGVEHHPGGAPKSFSIRYADNGREDLVHAITHGELSHLLTGTVLAQIGGGDQ